MVSGVRRLKPSQHLSSLLPAYNISLLTMSTTIMNMPHLIQPPQWGWQAGKEQSYRDILALTNDCVYYNEIDVVLIASRQ